MEEKNFKELGLNDGVLKVITEERFEKPTQIQERAIPLILKGKNVVGQSATGSGKTLAFISGMLNNSKYEGSVDYLIVTPTRELAKQIAHTVKLFSKYLKDSLKVVEIFGGVGYMPQINGIRRSKLVVGTPGRLLDLIEKGNLSLKNVKTLVLDECDVMVDMGFLKSTEEIIKNCPKDCQKLLFSATINHDVKRILKNYMKEHETIEATKMVDSSKLEQFYVEISRGLKFSLLVHLLKTELKGLAMVFCNTQRNTDFVSKNLKKNGFNSLGLHGGLTQSKRNKILADFRNKNFDVLVCTDVAARGLDIKGVDLVLNYDIPNDSKNYLHRIGRTARAGGSGRTFNVLTETDFQNFENVLHDNKVKINKIDTPNVEKVKIFQIENNSNRNYNRGRGGGGRDRNNKRRSSNFRRR